MNEISVVDGRSKIKMVMLGDQGVGKSSVVEKFIQGKFDDTAWPTVGIDFFAKEFLYKNQKTRLQLWDTAGQERFRSLIPSYLKNSHCAILVLDLSNKHSFENIESWLSMYRENTVGIPIAILAGNKADKVEERINEFEEVDNMAKHLGMKYVQISAKTGYNLDLLFQTCLDQIFQSKLQGSQVKVEDKFVEMTSSKLLQSSQPKQPQQQFALRNDILNMRDQEVSKCRC